MLRIPETKVAGTRKLLSCLLIFFTFSFFMAGCNSNTISNNGNVQEAANTMLDKLYFIRVFKFDTNHPDGTNLSRSDLINYSDIVFVMDESEQVNYPKGVLVAWPSINTERILYSVNLVAICFKKEDPAPYGLAYPITMTDVVDQ